MFVVSDHPSTLSRFLLTQAELERCNPMHLHLQLRTVHRRCVGNKRFPICRRTWLRAVLGLFFPVIFCLFSSLALGFLGMDFLYKEDHQNGYKSGQIFVVSLGKFPLVQSLKKHEYKYDLSNMNPGWSWKEIIIACLYLTIWFEFSTMNQCSGKQAIMWNHVDEVIVEYDMQSIYLFLTCQTGVSFL